MMRQETHECPDCGGAIPREDFAEVAFRETGVKERYLHCAFCDAGWEAAFLPDGTIFRLDFRRSTEPVNFSKFLQRLEDARAA